jgi:hypothetical protein
LAGLPEVGDGIVHRVIVEVQRRYFDPPDDARAGWDIAGEAHRSKLIDAPAIEREPRDRRNRSSRARMSGR